MTDFAAFVITFRRPAVLETTLRALLAQTTPPKVILVVDNGAEAEAEEVARGFADQGVRYHPMPENLGPAGASACALRILVGEGHEWIYFGDEDDPPAFPDVLDLVLRTAVAARDRGDRIGGAGAVGARFDWTTGQNVRLRDDELTGVVDVDSIGGNSQLIVHADVVREVGLPDERLFFGGYEPEYCLRIRRAGYRLLVDGPLMWRHRENAGRLGIEIRPAIVSDYLLESLWRRYYRTRNYIFMMRTTFRRPDLARREATKAVARAIFSWLRGPRYGWAFSRLQLQGLIDGYRSRMGRTIVPQAKRAESGGHKGRQALEVR